MKALPTLPMNMDFAGQAITAKRFKNIMAFLRSNIGKRRNLTKGIDKFSNLFYITVIYYTVIQGEYSMSETQQSTLDLIHAVAMQEFTEKGFQSASLRNIVNLDVENETLIQATLSRLIQDKTVLVIAHRMRTVSGADKVVVLSDGTVAEQGKPEELINTGTIYPHMVHLQRISQDWGI